MRHAGTSRIETPRLILRPFQAEDAQAMFEHWASSPEVTRYLTWPPHESMENTRRLLANWEERYQDPAWYNWAIALKDGDVGPVGNISVVKTQDDIRQMEIGYCLGASWWRRGIMTEALEAVMDDLFRRTDVNRIQAVHDTRNPGSGQVMRRCGMRLEGEMRSAGLNNSGICDVRVYAMLRRDWEEQKCG